MAKLSFQLTRDDADAMRALRSDPLRANAHAGCADIVRFCLKTRGIEVSALEADVATPELTFAAPGGVRATVHVNDRGVLSIVVFEPDAAPRVTKRVRK
jgi:hypothetical protein